MKILLVEDSKFLRFSTERALTKAGHDVLSAVDGEQGLNIARQESPDLILLDVILPKMSGCDMLQSLKADPGTSAIPVVMLTGISTEKVKELEQYGAVAIFEKSDSMLQQGVASLLAFIERFK